MSNETLSKEHFSVSDFFTTHGDGITCECDLCKLVFATSTQHNNLLDHLEDHTELKALYHFACCECGNSYNDFRYADFCKLCGKDGFHDTTFYKVSK